MASRQDGITQLYDLPQGGGPERLPQPEKTKDKVLLDERGLLDLPFLALTVLLVLIGVIMVFSASYARAYYLTGNSTYYFARQAIFAVAVNAQLQAGTARVRVLPCEEVWHGVTYREDLASVKDAIRALKAAGVYEERLWPDTKD